MRAPFPALPLLPAACGPGDTTPAAAAGGIGCARGPVAKPRRDGAIAYIQGGAVLRQADRGFRRCALARDGRRILADGTMPAQARRDSGGDGGGDGVVTIDGVRHRVAASAPGVARR